MSPSSGPRRKATRVPAARVSLTVYGPPGVELLIFDGTFNRLHRGSEVLKASLPRGLYVVRWVTPDAMREEIVNFLEGPLRRKLDCPSDLIASSKAGLANARPKSRPSRDAAIVVVEQSRDAGLRGSIAAVRLFDGRAVAMRSDSSAVEAIRHEMGSDPATGLGWAVRVYPVDPGLFRLRYETPSGAQVDQAVPAIRGRRTIVVLRQVTARTLVNQDAGHALIYRRGADPARTVILSVPQSRLGPPNPLDVVLAESILGDIDSEDPIATFTTLKRLASPKADPLLQLYAATSIVAFLARRDTSAEPRGDVGPGPRGMSPADWQQLAERLLIRVGGIAPFVSDVALLRRQLEYGGGRPRHLPMLAANLALLEPGETGLGFPGEEGKLSHTPQRVGPWALRSAEAIKGGRVSSGLPQQPKGWGLMTGGALAVAGPILVAIVLSGAMPSLYVGMWKLTLAGLETLSAVGFAGLSIIGLALAFFMGREFRQAHRAFAAYDPQEAAAKWDAIPHWVPHREQLRRRGRKRAELSAPPFTRRPVLFPDDPNKGRFGGLAECAGFMLVAEFYPSDPGWVEVALEVRSTKGKRPGAGERAHIFLHESFKPSEIAAKFEHGTARLVVNAFGGFTVGVWLPERRVELELDLASLDDAPELIKNW